MTIERKATMVIEVEAVQHRYGRVRALDGLDLRVAEGSVYALLGRNGAGKSTLVKGLLGLQRPQAGRLRLFGRDAWSGRAEHMARTGVVLERPDAPPAMTVAELDGFHARLHRAWDTRLVAERLDRAGIDRRTPFGRLSRGQQAQVMLALALGGRPDLLILDDPTLGLDAAARRAFYGELLAELADRGVTVFLTSHDLASLATIASHVGILHQGRLRLDAPVDAVRERFRLLRGPADAGWEADLPVLRRTRHAWGTEVLVDRCDPEGLPATVTAALPSLEDLFIHLTAPEAQP